MDIAKPTCGSAICWPIFFSRSSSILRSKAGLARWLDLRSIVPVVMMRKITCKNAKTIVNQVKIGGPDKNLKG